MRVLAMQVPKDSLDNVKQLIDEVGTAFKQAAPATREIFDNLADDVEGITDQSSSSSSSNSDAGLADHSAISNSGAPKRKRYRHKKTAVAKRPRWCPNTDNDARPEVLPKTQRGYTRAEFPLWCSTPKKPGLAAPTRPQSPVSSIDSGDNNAAAPAISNDPVGSAWQPIVLSD